MMYIKFEQGENENQIKLTLMVETENGLVEVSEEHDSDVNMVSLYALVVMQMLTFDETLKDKIVENMKEVIERQTNGAETTENTDGAVLDCTS